MDLRFTTEYPSYRADRAADVTCLCTLTAPASELNDRAPVSLSAVLDRSGSMAGAPLELVKSTMQFLVQQMTSRDSLGIVQFDDQVKTVLPLYEMSKDKKELAKSAINSVQAGGATNLSGGLFEGVRQQQAQQHGTSRAPSVQTCSSFDWDMVGECEETRNTGRSTVQSVFLFTDGMANRGVTSTSEVSEVLSKLLGSSKDSLTVSCFGFSGDHDDKMLEGISQAGKGMYYFIENKEGIPTALASAFGGLLSTCAQSVELKLIPKQGVVLKAVKTSYPTQNEASGAVKISIGDLYAEERKDIVLEVQVSAVPPDAEGQVVATAELTYLDISKAQFTTVEAALQVTRAPQEDHSTPAPEVVGHRNRLLAVEAMKAASEQAESGNIARAQEILETMLSRMHTDDDIVSVNLRNDLQGLRQTVASTMAFGAGGGSKLMRSNMTSHRCQRAAAPRQAARSPFHNPTSFGGAVTFGAGPRIIGAPLSVPGGQAVWGFGAPAFTARDNLYATKAQQHYAAAASTAVLNDSGSAAPAAASTLAHQSPFGAASLGEWGRGNANAAPPQASAAAPAPAQGSSGQQAQQGA